MNRTLNNHPYVKHLKNRELELNHLCLMCPSPHSGAHHHYYHVMNEHYLEDRNLEFLVHFSDINF